MSVSCFSSSSAESFFCSARARERSSSSMAAFFSCAALSVRVRSPSTSRRLDVASLMEALYALGLGVQPLLLACDLL